MLLYKEICTNREQIINLCNKVLEIELSNDTNSYFINKLARFENIAQFIEISYILSCEDILIDKSKTYAIYFCANHYDSTDIIRITFLDKENSLLNLFSNNLRLELSIEFHKNQISDFCNERHGEYTVSVKN